MFMLIEDDVPIGFYDKWYFVSRARDYFKPKARIKWI
jgi:hypothetical protein